MGASSSTEQNVSTEQREVEAEAASTGALPMLQKAFSRLANPETNAVPPEKLRVLKTLLPILVYVLFFHFLESVIN